MHNYFIIGETKGIRSSTKTERSSQRTAGEKGGAARGGGGEGDVRGRGGGGGGRGAEGEAPIKKPTTKQERRAVQVRKSVE